MAGAVAAGGVSCCAQAGSTLCCFASHGVASGCNAAGKAGERAAQMTYIAMVLISSILAIVLKQYAHDWLDELPGWDSGCVQSECLGNQAVYRVSLTNVVFFGFMLLFGPCCAIMHRGMWQAKLPLYLLLLVGSFFLPNDAFTDYYAVARILSIAFLLLQVFILVEFAYDANDALVQWADAEEKDQVDDDGNQVVSMCQRWRVLYIILLVGGFGGCVAGCGLMFGAFDCSFAKGMTAIVLVFGILVMALACIIPARTVTNDEGEVIGNRGQPLLAASVTGGYCAWLLFSALGSYDSKSCNPMRETTSDATMWMGFAFAAVSIAYAGYSVGNGALDALYIPCICGWCASPPGGSSGGGGKSAEENEANQRGLDRILAGEDAEKVNAETKAEIETIRRANNTSSQSADIESGEQQTVAMKIDRKQVVIFHMTMVVTGFYQAMVLTNWAELPPDNSSFPTGSDAASVAQRAESEENLSLGVSDDSMTIKLVCMFLTMVFFLLTLIMPMLCPDRDFSA